MLVSIIIPIYNEQQTAEKIIRKVAGVVLKEARKEIIVIDDCSTDDTPNILKKIQHTFKFKLVKHKKNLGKGAAIRSGFKESRGEILIIQDADLEYDPKYYTQLLAPIISGKTKIVYGNRFADYPLKLWGKDKTILPHHWLANKLLTKVTNFLYGSSISDMETGYKVFRGEVLEGITLHANRFDIEVELTAKLLLKGYQITEVPIKVNPRSHKEGKKISWRDGLVAAWVLFKYRFI